MMGQKGGIVMEWYISVLKKYAVFQGRARRKEYWMFVLFNFIIAVVLSILSRVAGIFGIVSALYSLAVLIPGLAVCVRRLHDIGKSGWWLFLVLVPLVGSIILLVWYCKDSEEGENDFGPCPKTFY